MKKFSKFIKDLFTKNIDIKLLAIAIAVVAVIFVNIPNV